MKHTFETIDFLGAISGMCLKQGHFPVIQKIYQLVLNREVPHQEMLYGEVDKQFAANVAESVPALYSYREQLLLAEHGKPVLELARQIINQIGETITVEL